MLEVEGLSVDYERTRVIEDLDLALSAGEILTLVGPTGCGKSTILRAVAGLIPIAAGEVRLGGWRASTDHPVPPEARNVGMVFQDFALFPHLSVLQNVSFRLSDSRDAESWLELLGITELRDAKPSTLSGGQKQRVALARTLAHRPALVLLDEPLSNLDAALKDSLRWEIRDALKEAQVPAIWVTHDQDEALSIGDRLGVLREGHLEQFDTPERCFCEPANRFVARFLGEAGFLPGTLRNMQVETALGHVSCVPTATATPRVDVLIRPGDLRVCAADADANATITGARYEGGSRLYGLKLDDDGTELQVRVAADVLMDRHQRARIEITATRPLAAFSNDESSH